MAKIKCVPRRVNKKPGVKMVKVGGHKRSTPKKICKKCSR